MEKLNIEEVRSRRIALQRAMEAEQAGISKDLPEGEYDDAMEAVNRKYMQELYHLRKLECALGYREVTNKWFCEFVAKRGPGMYGLSADEAACIRRYFEAGKDSKCSHNVYCTAAGFICELYEHGRVHTLTIEAI